MGLREQLAEKPAIGIIAAVIVIAGAVWYITAQGGTKRLVDQSWYYDLDDAKLIAGEVGQVPPFTTTGGHTAVRAAVFSCGDCADESARFIAYLEKYSDAYVAAMGDPDAFTPEVAEEGQLVRAADGGEWVAMTSPAGQTLLTAPSTKCSGATPRLPALI